MGTTVSPEVLQEPVSVDDNASSLTVDGTVTANLSATDNAVLDQIELNTDPLLVVGSGTEATAQRVTIASDSTGVLSVDDNGASLTIDNAQLSVVGSGTEATALRVTVASDSTGVLSVDDNGGSLTVDGTVTTTPSGDHTVIGKAADGAAVSGNPVLVAGQDGTNVQTLKTDSTGTLQVDIESIPTVTVSATDLDIRNLAQATDSVSIGDGTDTVSVLTDGADNVGNTENQLVTASLIYGYDGTNWDRVTNGNGTAATALRVTVASDSTGTTIATGAAANASPASGNPVYVAGRASAVIPTDVGADGDVAAFWTNRNGAVVVLQAPHLGLNGDPWSLVHEGVQYTTAQTSTVVVAGGVSEKIVVTQVQIQCFSTTAGTAILYFGTGAFSRGTNRAIFDGDFTPSATLKPGVILNGPFIAGTNGDDLMFTSVGDLDITLSIWYYVVT